MKGNFDNMKTITPRFVFIKLLVLLFVNLLTFAPALLLTLILGSLENVTVARLIASGVSGVLFYAYLFTATRSMKSDGRLSKPTYIMRECIVGLLFLIVVSAVMIVCGDGFATNYVFMFFLPNSFFHYLTGNAVLGFVCHAVVFAVVVTAARIMAKDVEAQ